TGDPLVEPPQLGIRTRRGLLDLHGGRDEFGMGPEPADGEVVDRALRLRAVERAGRYLHVAERVTFEAIFHHADLAFKPRANQIILPGCLPLSSTASSNSSRRRRPI